MTMTKAELNNPNFDHVIAEPVWDDEVQWFFREDYDVPHMKGIIDLASFAQVSSLSAKIYYYVFYKMMPAPWGPKPTPWNHNKAFSFRNWLTHDCPKDQAALEAFKQKQASIAQDASLRQRKNINAVDGVEKDNLITALSGIMALSKDDPRSFYQVGGIHWYPAPTYCEHHIHPFLSWHRAYLMQFEDALRSIPGCEDVTVPYWDVTDGTYPEIFSEAPFNNYQVPQEFLAQYPQEVSTGALQANGDIIRNSAQSFTSQLWQQFRDADHDPNNVTKIDLGLVVQSPTWNAFNGIDTSGNYTSAVFNLMHAHDTVHNINGPTTGSQDVTGFEPVFWLFHANWDRLWWQWQKLHNATTVDGFKQNVLLAGDQTDWIDGDALKILDPFTDTIGLSTDTTIDLNALGVNYVETALPLTQSMAMVSSHIDMMRVADKGQSKASAFQLGSLSHVSLRVKDVDRLKIPGAFTVSLYLGDEAPQVRHFFQPTEPGTCKNCSNQPLVSFDFVFLNEILQRADGRVKVEIQLAQEDADGDRPVIPFSEIGDPTINIRLVH